MTTSLKEIGDDTERGVWNSWRCGAENSIRSSVNVWNQSDVMSGITRSPVENLYPIGFALRVFMWHHTGL